MSNINIAPNGLLTPITLELNSSTGKEVTYEASSSNERLITTTVNGTLLHLNLTADLEGESNITVVAKSRNQRDSKIFTVYVKKSTIIVVNPVSNEEEISSGNLDVVRGEVHILGEENNGIQRFNITHNDQTTTVESEVEGMATTIANDGNVTITLTSQKRIVIKIESTGQVNPEIEDALLPKEGLLPQGTKIKIQNNQIEFVIPMPDKLTF